MSVVLYYWLQSKGDNTFGSVHLLVCSRSRSYVWHVVVDIRAWLADCSKSTMTHGIQSKISVCLSVIKKLLRSRAVRSGQGLLLMTTKSYIRKITAEDFRSMSEELSTVMIPIPTTACFLIGPRRTRHLFLLLSSIRTSTWAGTPLAFSCNIHTRRVCLESALTDYNFLCGIYLTVHRFHDCSQMTTG